MSAEFSQGPHGADRERNALLDAAALAARDARERLACAVADLFRRDDFRLSDLQRVFMTQLLGKLVGAIEQELRARLLADPELPDSLEFRASIASGRIAIALPILERADMLRDPDLVAALLRRVEEHRLGAALRAHADAGRHDDRDPGGDPGDDELAAAQTAVLIAESRRHDRFDDPAFARTDLPDAVQRWLVWRIAAALHDYAVREHQLEAARLDLALTTSVETMLAARGENETLEVAALRLCGLLASRGELGDAALAEMFSRGRLALYVAALATRADLDFETAWEMAVAPEQGLHAVLLRAIGVGRGAAARLLLAMQVAHGASQAGEVAALLIEDYDALEVDAARVALRSWRLDPAYRVALVELAAAPFGRAR